MAKRKTDSEIKQEIKDLKALKPRVRRSSAFGDDHHAAIDAQVEVLEYGLDEDEVEDRADENDWPDNVRDSAMEAARWMAGESELARLVDDWESLVIK